MIRSLFITAAALAALIAPTQASALGRSLVGSVTVHSGPHGDWQGGGRRFGDNFACDSRRGRDGHGRRGRGGSSCTVFADSWGYYDPDFNRGWDSDSYNDWWHDRPDRAYPRWVRHNRDCDPERMWWSGDGWHC